MSEEAKLLLQAPKVDVENHQQRKLLEAELFSLNAQIRNFGRIRDRLSTTGKDGTSFYRDMEARRDQIVAALKQLGSGIFAPKLSDPRTPFPRLDRPLLALPIAPAKFVPETGIFGFGTSGFVQMAPASEGANDVATGKFPATGQIVTIDGADPGTVFFSGDLNVGPQRCPGSRRSDHQFLLGAQLDVPHSISTADGHVAFHVSFRRIRIRERIFPRRIGAGDVVRIGG